MDIVGPVRKAIETFWNWIAGDFWPALLILILGFIYTEVRSRRDAGEVANRMQLREYMEWKKSYLSGDLTGSTPPNPGADPHLRWFVVRKNKKPKKVIISNRGDSAAYNVRVRLAESTRMASWRWRVRAGRSMRFKIGKVSDKNWNGVALDIHWDDRKVLAQKVTFIVPQSEFELPKPVVSKEPYTVTASGSSPSDQPAPVVPPATVAPPTASATELPVSAPAPPEGAKPPLPAPSGSASFSSSLGGTHASTNIADRRIPNRTPGFPAKFRITLEDGQMLLKNLGPGDASHVHLQPLDDDQDVIGESFWLSIPFGKAEPFLLRDTRHVGVHVITFRVSWDDGFQLKRNAKVEYPQKVI